MGSFSDIVKKINILTLDNFINPLLFISLHLFKPLHNPILFLIVEQLYEYQFNILKYKWNPISKKANSPSTGTPSPTQKNLGHFK